MNTICTTGEFMDDVEETCFIEMEDLNEYWDCEVITVDDSSAIDEPQIAAAQWSELPSLPLELIYSFLNRPDQIRMSQVCRKWSEGYSSPPVWKSFQFYLPYSEISSEICPEVKFARKYSSMFRHVEIASTSIRIGMTDQSWRQLKVFLHILTHNSQLQSIKFRNLGNYLRQLDDETYADIFRSIASFLESQNHLKSVEFRDCFYPFQEGVELLRAATEKSRESLSQLVFRGFVDDEFSNREQHASVAVSLPSLVSERLSNLTVLETDYSLIFDNMFPRQPLISDAFKNSKMNNLSKLVLHCEGFKQSHFQGLSSAFWRCFSQYNPKLKIELYFVPGSQSRREMEFYILPGMPITLLDYRLDRLHASSVMAIEVLYNHLLACKMNDHLLAVYLVWMRPIPDLSTLHPFLQACSKLKCLQLFTLYPANGIDVLLRSWIENRPASLQEVLISISNVRNEDDYLSLTTVADEYVPLLQVLGLNVFLIIDSNWR
ncbi:f-box domain-containing protein [Caerostris darwini]|uniref:F-box domain-containing protein n=1 Tax=Caerostris darwini TaxID=1538125 RepID=A0AAV4UV02_9ARAC|nr:f-box domain-containing protein [Caerostris darwini]